MVDGPALWHTSIKMANMSEDYLVVDDLDDLFFLLEGGFIDEDADLNREVDDLVSEVAADEENAEGCKCNSCDKICKSQPGLTRHKNATHKHVSGYRMFPVRWVRH